jgi:hypothetical protein
LSRNRVRLTVQWRRTAFALAALFGSLPLASRLLLGFWSFEGAGGIAVLWAIAGCYLHLASRRFRTLPDPATLMAEAHELALQGLRDEAIARLTEAIRLSPRLWQAYEYRGQLYLLDESDQDRAVSDFAAARRLQ